MHKTLTTVLSVIVILLCITAGFFAWQNQRLVKQIRESLPTPSPTPSPTGSPSGTPDPYIDWKEYKEVELKLSFKAPLEINVKVVDNIITLQDYPFGAPPPDDYYKATVVVADGAIDKTTTLKGDKTITDQVIATFIWEN